MVSAVSLKALRSVGIHQIPNSRLDEPLSLIHISWGPSTNGLSPAVSESCGTWGNNILCENVDYIHLINVSKIALPLDVQVPSPEELFKD